MTHSYPAPSGPVLLLSCLDQPLPAATGQFVAADSLPNRYVQFSLAGCALGADLNRHWEQAFFDHLDVACKHHHIQDVYLLEHRHCGAYQAFLGEAGTFDDSAPSQEQELMKHRDYAHKLAEKIHAWGAQHGRPLRVRSFLLDAQGQPELLDAVV